MSKLRFSAAVVAAMAGLFFAGTGMSARAAECGEEIPCELTNGEYYVHLPENRQSDEPLGAIFFLHGHLGKAKNVIRNKNFQKMADDLGVAFVAVQGIEGHWSFPTAPRRFRDEPAFFDEVLNDISGRFGVDRKRTMLSGFSAGGFMTWYVACADSDQFAGYAPIAGAFWQPLPDNCPTKAPYLFHVHGTTDTVVPLEGRALRGGRWHQGDVFKSFDIWLRQNGLAEADAKKVTDGKLKCERWVPKTGFLELCLHGGGHSVQANWIKRAWLELSDMKGWNRRT